MWDTHAKLDILSQLLEPGSCLLEEEPADELDPHGANQHGPVPTLRFFKTDQFVSMPGPCLACVRVKVSNSGEPCSPECWEMR